MLWGLFILLAAALAALVLIGTSVLVYTLTHPPRRTEGVAIARGEPTNPIEAGAPQYTTIHLQSRSGEDIDIWNVPGRDPEGPVIVMLHGWGDGRLGELLWLDLLLPVASQLVLFDLRGHGACDWGRCAWGVGEVDDALVVIDAVCGSDSRSQVVLFGYSMGSAIAMMSAARAVAKVSAVIADSPYRSMAQAVRGAMRLHGLPTWPIVPLALAWLRFRGAIPSTDDLTSLAHALQCPLLVLHGGRDSLTSVGDAQVLSAAARDATLVVFPERDHLQAACGDRVEYEQALRDFLVPIKKGPAHRDCGTEPFRG